MSRAREYLARVAATLPRQQRAVFLLRELEGLSYGQIAGRLGISRSAVESLLFRARRRFTQEYLRLDGEEPTPCSTIRHLVEVIGRADLGAWQVRQVARHLDHCHGCRSRVGRCLVDPPRGHGENSGTGATTVTSRGGPGTAGNASDISDSPVVLQRSSIG